MSLDPRLRVSKEQSLFIIGVFFSGLCWVLATISIVGIFIALGVIAVLLMVHALYLAHVRGNGVRVSEKQLPDLYQRCQSAAKKLGLEKAPDVYVVQAGGLLNAFATKLLSRRYVVIYSDLVDHCADPRQLDFVIGHELGHIAAGHLAWNAFLAPFHLLPWLGAAYSRAREYTCDRCGFVATGDLEMSLRGLVVLAAGGKIASACDVDAFMAQRDESGGFWMATLELVSSHPYLCKRVAALKEFNAPGTVPAVERTPLAYPFAPVLGALAGGPQAIFMIAVFYVGVLAAIAIPAFNQARERAATGAAAKAAAGAALEAELKALEEEDKAMGADDGDDERDGDPRDEKTPPVQTTKTRSRR